MKELNYDGEVLAGRCYPFTGINEEAVGYYKILKEGVPF